MTDRPASLENMRTIRDNLIAQLSLLDALGEHLLAAELNAVIERINGLLGEPTSSEEIERLRNRYFSN
jgi:hypothetical protein